MSTAPRHIHHSTVDDYNRWKGVWEHLEHAPNVAVEALSESTRGRDLTTPLSLRIDDARKIQVKLTELFD